MSQEVTEMERKLEAMDTAFASLQVPEPPSNRQLIIARQAEIRRLMAQGHKLQAIRDVLAKVAGVDIPIGTLRDYVYNAEPSKAGRAAKAARVRKKVPAPSTASTADTREQMPFSTREDATEATAAGKPVRARKLT